MMESTVSPLDERTFSWTPLPDTSELSCLEHLQWLRERRFSRDCHEVLVEGTVSGSISHVVRAFQPAGRQNPTKDDDHELCIIQPRQYQEGQSQTKKALPFIVLDELANQQITELDIIWYGIGTTNYWGSIFCLLRLRIFEWVPKSEERWTKPLCWNISFSNDGHLISAPLNKLELADSVTITFEMQKNNSKYNTVIPGWRNDTLSLPSSTMGLIC